MSRARDQLPGRLPQGSIPVLRPLLPPADRLMPYLRRIDETRTYANWGPLARELEQRLSSVWRLPAGTVAVTGSGTTALIGSILAAAGRATPARPLAIIPAFTFVATAVAVEHCGFRPHLADIDPQTWTLDPERMAAHPRLAEAGVIVPVAAYGRPVPQAAWRAFQRRTGVPVVIDGAAGFEALQDAPDRLVGEIPVAVSFHATKSFGTGEGGCVVSSDAALVARAGQALNFGFSGSRDSCAPSTNGKMSEYHAAVGLAELDGWREKRLALTGVARAYRNWFERAGRADDFWGVPAVGGCYSLFLCSSAVEAERVQQALASADIAFRLWYGRGLPHHPAFSDLSRDTLDHTDDVISRLLGLPTAPDLPDAIIELVVSTVRSAWHDRPASMRR